LSSDSESEREHKPEAEAAEKQVSSEQTRPKIRERRLNCEQNGPKTMSEAEVSAAFTKYYMQRATTEFAEDLDRVRGADDFKGEALTLLIHALQQGTSIFSSDEQRRIITAEVENEEKEEAGE
jgi:ribosome assembly protein 3